MAAVAIPKPANTAMIDGNAGWMPNPSSTSPNKSTDHIAPDSIRIHDAGGFNCFVSNGFLLDFRVAMKIRRAITIIATETSGIVGVYDGR